MARFRAPTLALLVLALALSPVAAGAQERRPEPRAARNELWLSLSATVLLGGIAGSFALKAAALEDRIELVAPGTRELFQLEEDALNARRWAWGFGTGASLMAVTSLLVLLYQPAHTDTAVGPVLSANGLGIDCRGRF